MSRWRFLHFFWTDKTLGVLYREEESDGSKMSVIGNIHATGNYWNSFETR